MARIDRAPYNSALYDFDPHPRELIPVKNKLITLDQLPRLREENSEAVIALATGCFDVLHYGHLNFLIEAKKLADILVVGINNDVSVRALKGPTRPIHSEEERQFLIAGMQPVDFVYGFDDLTAEGALELLRPDIYAITDERLFNPDKPEIAKARNSPHTFTMVQICPHDGIASTSRIIKKINGN
jgi:rfaE bifunctional protein nucleotidyltransferase chain/domain